MKNFLLFTLTLLFTYSIQAQNVNIPDANFKAALVGNSNINTNGDTEIQVSEAAAFTATINVSGLSISDLTGIEAFTNLLILYCTDNSLTSLDLSANTSLIRLGCGYNNLTSLDLSTNTALDELVCNNNQLTSLDISANTALTELICWNNELTNLDVSANTALTWIGCNNNQLTSLDVSANTMLSTFSCNGNQLASLDVSTNTALELFHCYQNQLTSLDLRNGNNTSITDFIATSNPNLTCIQVDDPAYSTANWTNVDAGATFSTTCSTSACTVNIPDANFKAYLLSFSGINTNGNGEIECDEALALTGTIAASNQNIADATGIEAFVNLQTLIIENNQISSLDVSQNTALQTIDIRNNQLTSINLGNNTNLKSLNVFNSNLTSIDLSNQTGLTSLNVNGNQLTSLDLTNNPALIVLRADNNALTSIDLSQNTLLQEFDLSNNSLTVLDLSNQTDLSEFGCANNNLTALDVSTNPNAGGIYCEGNNITDLDFSQNSQLQYLTCQDNALVSLNLQNGNNSIMVPAGFDARNNPGLNCIRVDDVTYSTANWTNIDPGAYYSTTCSTSVENLEENELSISPNPTNGYLHIDTDYSIVRYKLFNINGQQLLTGISTDLDISALPKGMYILKIQTDQGTAQRKIMKE